MKKEATITSLLGITQHDAAILVGVHPSQWSMYSSGRRGLPAHAAQMVGEMLTFLKANEHTTKNSGALPQNEVRVQLERMLQENDYQQMRLARQITGTTKKRATQSRMLLLSEFLASRPLGKPSDSEISEVFADKASRSLESLTALLVKQQHRQELLDAEKKLLESKLKKLA